MFGGKISQPWFKVADRVIWDNDINPEGVAAQYSRKFGDVPVQRVRLRRGIHAENNVDGRGNPIQHTTCGCNTGSSARTCIRAKTSR